MERKRRERKVSEKNLAWALRGVWPALYIVHVQAETYNINDSAAKTAELQT